MHLNQALVPALCALSLASAIPSYHPQALNAALARRSALAEADPNKVGAWFKKEGHAAENGVKNFWHKDGAAIEEGTGRVATGFAEGFLGRRNTEARAEELIEMILRRRDAEANGFGHWIKEEGHKAAGFLKEHAPEMETKGGEMLGEAARGALLAAREADEDAVLSELWGRDVEEDLWERDIEEDFEVLA